MSEPRVEDHGGGVFLVVFPAVEDVTAAKSIPIVATLAEASKQGPIALLAATPPDIRLVEPSMISYWLQAINSGQVRAECIGVVSKAIAVRIALKALQSALKVYGKDTLIATHPSIEVALAWARENLKRPLASP